MKVAFILWVMDVETQYIWLYEVNFHPVNVDCCDRQILPELCGQVLL